MDWFGENVFKQVECNDVREVLTLTHVNTAFERLMSKTVVRFMCLEERMSPSECDASLSSSARPSKAVWIGASSPPN